MKKPLNDYVLQFLLAAIPLALVQAYRVDASPAPVLSRPVPAERIHWIPDLLPSQTPATLHVIRESRWKGWAMPITLLIDGKPVASLKDGENVMVRIPAGEHTLGLKYLGQDPLGLKPVSYSRRVAYYESVQPLEGGKCHDFRIVPTAQWNWQLDREIRQSPPGIPDRP